MGKGKKAKKIKCKFCSTPIQVSGNLNTPNQQFIVCVPLSSLILPIGKVRLLINYFYALSKERKVLSRWNLGSKETFKGTLI